MGLVALGGAVLVVAASTPVRAFTLTETGAALGTANSLAASNGVSGAHTRGVVQRRLSGIGVGRGLNLGGPAGGFGSCGRRSSARTPSKSWKRAAGPAARLRITAAWKRGGMPPARTSRIAWARGADPSRCR